MHFALVQTLYRARGSPKFPQISIDCTVTSSCRSTLQARPRRYAFCTDPVFTFSGSHSPWLAFDVHPGMMQALHRARGGPKLPQISIDGAMRNLCRTSSFQARPRQYAFCTKGLHYQALLPLSFLFTYNLHWCNHCTGLDVAPNFRKFPLIEK